MASMVRQPRILQKFYVYDPNVSDTFGGLRVLQDKDDKGNPKDDTNHVLAVTQQVQYWIDQGLIGDKPVGEISGAHKKLLAQITRGRSEDNDKNPGRIPRYDRRIQSGAPGFAGQPAYATIARNQRKQKKKEDRLKEAKPTPKTEPKVTPSASTTTRG
jgi:hypothetical protein